MSSLRLLALLLLAGSVLLLAGAALHPILPLTPEADLAMIAATPHWRAIHFALLLATALIIGGIWAVWLGAPAEARPVLVVAVALIAMGQLLNGLNIAFMTASGPELVRLHATEPAAASAIYGSLHPFAVRSGWFGALLVSLAALVLAARPAGARGDEPAWLRGVSWLAVLGGVVGLVAAPAGHPLMLTAFGVMAVWQAGMAAQLLRS